MCPARIRVKAAFLEVLTRIPVRRMSTNEIPDLEQRIQLMPRTAMKRTDEHLGSASNVAVENPMSFSCPQHRIGWKVAKGPN
jgi:hypothetical protein